MPAHDDLALLTDAVEEGGRIARRHLSAGITVTEKPNGAGPVTEADLEIDAFLRETLLAARPGYGWFSEESPDDGSRRTATHCFIADPIDGTRAFIKGQPGFCVAACLMREGAVTATAVHFPLLSTTYTAALGQGAHRDGTPIRVSARKTLAGARTLARRTVLEPGHWSAGVPDLTIETRASLIHRLCLVAEGTWDATLTLNPAWHWDIAPGTLILTEAGARATTATGTPPKFDGETPKTHGLIAANPALHEALMRHKG